MSRFTFPIDFATLDKGRPTNCYLVLPAGFQSSAQANLTSPSFSMSAEALLDRFTTVALSQPRVEQTNQNDTQREFTQRSAVFKFPDVITVQAMPVGEGAALAIFSRAKLGRRDFSVNEKRIKAWLDLIEP